MYRWAKPADKQAVMKLWAVDFESYEPYYSWYFNEVYRPELTLCDFEGAALAAALQVAPYQLSLAGEHLPVYYVVGVITDPAFRGQGRGRKLLTMAHEHMRQQGYAASLLYTDIPDFYKPLGYSHCYEQQTLRLPIYRGAQYAPAVDAPVVWATDNLLDNIEALDEIYRAMTARYDGYIIRGQHNWRVYLGEQACDKARLMMWPGRAYVLYTQNKVQLDIIELGFSDEEAARAALSAAIQAAQTAGLPQLLWHAPGDAPAIFPHIPGKYWLPRPFVMARINADIAPQARLLQNATPPRTMWINEYT